MILTEKLLKILIQSNKISPIIVGQLFTFVTKGHKFATVDGYRATNGFKIRWILLLCISFTFLLRFFMLKLCESSKNSPNVTVMESSVCIMMAFISLVGSERYRIRGLYPQNFVSFFNGAMIIERKYATGILHALIYNSVFCI